MAWREMDRCTQADRRCCHLRTHNEICMLWVRLSTPLAKGGDLPLASATDARDRSSACACAPNLPPSSIAKGTKMCGPPCAAEIGWLDVLSAINFLSSARFAAKPGTVAALSNAVFLYTVVMTASITRWRPSAKKSSATTSPGLELSASRKPLASVTIAASGTPASRNMVLMTPTSPAWNRWRIPPLGHRTTWRSNDSSSPACTPHCGQCCRAARRCRPRD